MTNGLFFSFLFIGSFIAAIIIVAPLQSGRKSYILAPLVIFLAGLGYFFWGNYVSWQQFERRLLTQKLVEQVQPLMKSPQKLISLLKTRLVREPKSAQGWYLLGKLYLSEKKYPEAVDALAKAHILRPKKELYAINYAHSLWMFHQQKFTPEIIAIFIKLLQNNPQQPDALAMLAMNAYFNHNYSDAIEYWERLLRLMPEGSKESFALRKAIVKAQQQIQKNRMRSS